MMKYTTIDRTDIRVSRLAFGTGSLHHLPFQRQRQNMLEAAASSGMTHFDTSPYYGYGLAERDIGMFLRGRRGAFTVATKVGLYPQGPPFDCMVSVWARKGLGKLFPKLSLPTVDWSVSRAAASLTQSLRRLSTDYVDFVFLHEPDATAIESDEFLRWLEAEQIRGRVRSWGVAGLADHVATWVRADHPLTKVVQTQDSLDCLQANFVLECRRKLQFTYGYLSSKQKNGHIDEPGETIKAALVRNPVGAVIVSTRRFERIAGLARAVR